MSSHKSLHMMDKIKCVVDKGIQVMLDTGQPVILSNRIADELNTDYNSVDALLQTVNGSSLDNFITSRILEKVKELLVYTEHSLTEIAHALGYQSPAYLSGLLKKHTGFTALYFKKVRQNKLLNIKSQLNAGDKGERDNIEFI